MKDAEVFEGKTFQELMKDIYTNSVSKKGIIETHIEELMKLMKRAEDAAIIAPIVKDFLEVSVKNDDQLVKMAQIVQRLLSAETQAGMTGSDMLSDEEKTKLLTEAMGEMKLSIEKTDTDLTIAESKAKEYEDRIQ